MSAARRVQHVMGTVVSVELVGLATSMADLLLDEIEAWFDHVDTTFSVYRADSLVSRVGRGEVSPTDPALGADGRDLIEVLDRCARLREESGGVFDAWRVPRPDGTRLDPSGVVKGWAVERAAERVRRAGATGWCVNAGGDIAVGGLDEDGRRWRLGLRHPWVRDGVVLVAELPTDPCNGVPFAMGMATSGSYERGVHVVDARSGLPCTEVASATVVGPSIAIADAYATIVYALGEQGLAWLVRRAADGYDGCVITHDDRLLTTPGFDLLVPAWRIPEGIAPLR